MNFTNFISLNNKQDLIRAIRKCRPEYKAKDLYKRKTKWQLIRILANVEYRSLKWI